MSERLNIPAQALPGYFESARKKGLVNACFELAGLEPSVYFKQRGGNEAGHQGVLFELGSAVSILVDSLDYHNGEQMTAFSKALGAYADLTEIIPFKSVDESNVVNSLTALTKSVVDTKPVLLPFVMCPDVDFHEGRLSTNLSDSRKKEIDLVSKAIEIFKKHEIEPSLRLILGNDWFHPLVRQSQEDPSSVEVKDIEQNLLSLKEEVAGVVDCCGIDLITTLPGFQEYQRTFEHIKTKLKSDEQWKKVAKTYQEKAKGKRSMYYQTLGESQREEVATDDVALYVATAKLLVSMIDSEVETGKVSSGIILAMESDPSSLARFYLDGGLSASIINLGTRYENN